MLIDNIHIYDSIKLYECSDDKEYLTLLKNGLTPIFVSKSRWYFVKDDKLAEILNLNG